MVSLTALRITCAGLLVLSTVAAAAAQNVSPRPATFSTSARLVLVPVNVTDHYSKTITGLQAKDFSIFDDQIAQQIVSFGSEDAPSSIGLVLDISGSMQRALSTVKDGVRAFVRNANSDDEFLLLTVSTLPAAGPAFTSDTQTVEASIAATRPGGLTALLDTAYLGLNQMPKARNPRRAMIIVSDGLDNHSRYSRNELLRAALEADVQIYSIILNTGAGGSSSGAVPFRPSMIQKPGDRSPELQGPELLEKLADKTGGLSFHARSDAEVQEAMVKAGEALRSEYVIGYRMPDSGGSGKWHQVHVKSTVPKVNIHARSGYYAP
jgi:Ca-activated chloride channel family protein